VTVRSWLAGGERMPRSDRHREAGPCFNQKSEELIGRYQANSARQTTAVSGRRKGAGPHIPPAPMPMKSPQRSSRRAVVSMIALPGGTKITSPSRPRVSRTRCPSLKIHLQCQDRPVMHRSMMIAFESGGRGKSNSRPVIHQTCSRWELYPHLLMQPGMLS